MRKLLAAFCLLAASSAALGQDAPVESVTVNGSTLIGLWRIDTPRTAQPGSRKVSWVPWRTRFCRVIADGDDLAVACLNGAPSRLDLDAGRVEMDDDKIHFAWGSMFAREVLDARLVSASRFEGSSGIKLSGVFLGSDNISTGTKLTITPDMSDQAGKAGLLTKVLAQLQDGALSEPHAPAASRAAAQAGRGKIRHLSWRSR